MTSASAATIRSQHKFVAYVDTTWPFGATEQARWSRMHQHRLGDDEVLPRHPDALEDRWAVLREGNGFSYNVTHGDEIIGRQGILRDGYHDVAGFPKRGRHVLDDHCGAAKQRRIELACVGFVGPDRNHDDVVGSRLESNTGVRAEVAQTTTSAAWRASWAASDPTATASTEWRDGS